MAERASVHRHEMSGVLPACPRALLHPGRRPHLLTPEQLDDEVRGRPLHDHIYAAFGFSDVKVELSTRPTKSIGSDEMWARAEGDSPRLALSTADGRALV